MHDDRIVWSVSSLLALGVGLGLGACNPGTPLNRQPSFANEIVRTAYDGTSDDLLTAGLGRSGLASATSPTIADANNPTAAELRRLAIYNNYRALVDVSAGGGYGTLYGPNVDASGNVTTGEGRVAGVEYVAYADDGSGRQNVTMAVQIPSTFDRTRPCIVAAPSSGSRGVYGAIGTAGEWGLKRGCVVALTDKGTGNGTHDLQNNTVNLIDGVRQDAAAASKRSHFTANLSDAERAAFNAATPNRFAFKHAHSQVNPEKDWGQYTLEAIEFAFYALNQELGEDAGGGQKRQTFRAGNTLVIAASVSNGGGSVLAAAEQDTSGWIDGVVVSEPNVNPAAGTNLTIRRGGRAVTGPGKPLFDYFTLGNLLQPCAALAQSTAAAPGVLLVNAARAGNRCAALKAQGLLTSTTTAEQAEEAQQRLREYGWEPESGVLHASLYALATPAIAVTYANTYGRFSVKDNLCGFSFAATATDGTPTALAPASLARIFGTGNGIPPTSGINLINNDNPAGPLLDGISTSPSTGQADLNADGALCLRGLWTGSDAAAQRVRSGVNEILRTGNLRGKSALIVHGRDDGLIPVSFASRAYFALNQQVEGAASRASYIEVTNAQHFDAFIGLPVLAGYDTRYVPLHVYFIRALDAMYEHLTRGAALPPSQVVRTVPRGGTPGQAPALTTANVPAVSQTPAAGDRIVFSGNTLDIPE
ncbi:MAG TPA: D-(-)-3-hydroxybutyrate oligomer hydrolase [Polyangia bacterium]|nr:D-(-)-3-hydroxybutyrate oligomer hydrolase [Polyangia bacterium]